MYVNIDDTGRVTLSTTRPEWANPGYYEVEEPADLDGHSIFDYVYSDGALVYDPLPEPEPQPSVDERLDAVEAKAEQALEGANPQLTTFARMQVATMDITADTDDTVASISTLLPDFVPDGHSYKVGDSFAYDGRTWRVAQAHTSQPQWVPGHGTDSLYYEIVIAPDGILVWRQPTGAHDAPGMGALRHYPDADGPVYESKRDGNISVPGTDEWWRLVD